MDTRIKPTANAALAPSRSIPVKDELSGKTLPEAGKTAPLKVVPDADQTPLEQKSVEIDKARKEQLAERVKISEKAAQRLNEVLRDRQRDLEFSVDETTGRTVLKVIHSESGEVIRQLPPEEILQIARAFIEGTGSLIDDEA